MGGEQRLAHEHAEGADDQHVGLRGRDPREHVRRVERLGLDQVEAERAGGVGDGRRRSLRPRPCSGGRAG